MRNATKRIALVLVFALLLQLLPGLSLVTTASAAETYVEVLYEEDFSEYTGDNTVTISKGESKEGWTYDSAYGDGTFQLKEGALYAVDAGSNAHLELTIPGAEYWQNYTVELDWTYVGSTAWGGVAYNSNGGNSHQKFGIHGTNGYFMNGNFGGHRSWINDGGTNNSTSSAVSNAADKTVRLKLVTSGMDGVNTGTSAMYIAYYDTDGNLGEWNHIYTVTNIDARTWRGTIGLACNSYSKTNAKVDNIKVYREAEVLYSTDFSDAENELDNWKVTGGVEASVADGIMTLESTGAYGHTVLNVDGSDKWSNYTVEADFTYTPNYYFAGIGFNWLSAYKNNKAGVYKSGTTDKYFINGTWSEDSESWLQYDHPSAGSANAAFTVGQKYRLKVSTTGQCGWQNGEAALAIAHYDAEGNLGKWIPISATGNIDSRLWQGPAGILTSSSTGTLYVDNFIVYKAEVTAPVAPAPANVAAIYDVTTTTGITNPPVVGEVMTNIHAWNPDVTEDIPTRTPALTLMEVHSISEDGIPWLISGDVALPADDVLRDIRGAIIPGFIIDSEEEALALAAYCEEINLIDAYVISEITGIDDADAIGYVTTAREAWTNFRGGVIIPTVGDTVEDWEALCLTMAADTDVTVVFAQEVVPLDAMSYFNNHSIAVWGFAEDKGDVFANIANGAHGILADDAQMIYDVYESIPNTTLSGRPMPITHRGAHMNYGGLSKVLKDSEGNDWTFWGYTENSVEAVVASWEHFGVLGSEIDLHTTKVCSGDDATCTHAKDLIDAGQASCGHTDCELCQLNIILEHDGNLTTTTNIVAMRSDERYGTLFTNGGNNKTNYTLYELKLLTLTGRGNNNVDVEDGHKLATFEEVLAATEDLANGNYVYYCHIGSANQAWFNAFLAEHPEYVDNCVIFMDASGIENSYNYKTLTAAVPITFADNSRLAGTVNQEHLDAIEDMILLMNRHNGHYLGYHYQRHTDGNDDFYYEAAARGIVTYHSITNGQSNLYRRHITAEGAVGCLTDDAAYVDEWFYAIELNSVPATVQSETALEVDATVRTIWGDANPEANIADPELGIVTISGPEFVKGTDGWYAAEGGTAEIVFYYDGTAEGASYRIYSEPVTVEVTANVTGVTMNTSAAEAVLGQDLYLYAAVTPVYATNKAVTWTSSDEDVATVADGVVTPIKTGETTITATTVDGSFTATCVVTVVGEDSAVAAVKALIDALPETVTAEDAEQIAEARAAYEDLLASQKVQVDNYADLLTAEAALEAALEGDASDAEAALEAAEAAQAEAEAKADEANAAAEAAQAAADEAKAAAEAAKADAELSEIEKEAAVKAAEEAEAAAAAAEAEAEAAAKELADAKAAVEAAEAQVEAAEAAAALAKAKFDALWALTDIVDRVGPELNEAKAEELIAIRDEAEAAIAAATDVNSVNEIVSAAVVEMAAIVMVDPAEKFEDVVADSWYYEAVTVMYNAGLMQGKSETIFGVNDNLTRGQLVTILYRIVGQPEIDNWKNPFSDVAEGAYYYDAVVWAANQGIVAGTSETTFAPNNKVTREQFAAILYRWIVGDAELELEDALAEFPDADSVSNYAVDAMNWAVSTGLISGIAKADGTYLAPQGNTTRAQAASILYRLLFVVE